MLQLLLSPRRGWEDIAVDGFASTEILRKGFVPLIVVVSLTCLPSLWYHSDATVAGVCERMVACFVKFLASFYVASFCFSLFRLFLYHLLLLVMPQSSESLSHLRSGLRSAMPYLGIVALG